MHAYMYKCIHACVDVYMYVYICIYVCMHVCIPYSGFFRGIKFSRISQINKSFMKILPSKCFLQIALSNYFKHVKNIIAGKPKG